MSTTKKVKLRVNILRIRFINTNHNTFDADLAIQATWREESFDDFNPESLIKQKMDDYWNPKLIISNALSIHKIKIVSAYFFKSPKVAMGRKLIRCCALFPLYYSSAAFPFEEVTLPVFITTERPYSEVIFIKDGTSNLLNQETLEDNRKWILNQTSVVFIFETDMIPHLGLSNLSLGYIGVKHHVLTYQCKIRRRSEIFFFSTFLWQTLMTYVSFSSFCINARLIHFRLMQSCLTLFLTTAIRSFTFDTYLIMSSTTYEEIFFMMSWMMQFFLSLWHVFCGVALFQWIHLEKVDGVIHVLAEVVYVTEVSMFYYLVKGQRIPWMDFLYTQKVQAVGFVSRMSHKIKT